MELLWILIIVLVLLWFVAFIGPSYYSRIPRTGGVVHVLLALALVLALLVIVGVL